MQVKERRSLTKGAQIALAAGLVLAAGSLLVYQGLFASDRRMPEFGKEYFTVDDGATLFTDEDTALPPFDHGGKQAVRAVVFECGGKRVIGRLERYNAEGLKAKKEIAAMSKVGPPSGALIRVVKGPGLEVKSPGDSKWVVATDPAAEKLINFRCPDGSTPVPVTP